MRADRAEDVVDSARRSPAAASKRAHPRARSSPCGRRPPRAPARRPRRGLRRSRGNRDGSGCRRACDPAQLRLAAGSRRPRHSAGIPRSGGGSAVPGRPAGRPRPGSRSCARRPGTASRSSSLAAERRHDGLRQDRDLAHHLGRHVEHRPHARRIGLAQRPRLFAGEIAVGVRHHGPDRVQR